MIREAIHQIWIDPTTSGRLPPPDVEENCAAWKQLHPDFEYKLWSLDHIMRLARLHDRSEVCSAISKCRFPAMQADLARLFLLEMAGGFWIDLKLHPRKAFLSTLISYDLLVIEHFPKYNLPDPNGFLINSFIGSCQNHPCITTALDCAIKNVNRRMPGSIFYVAGSTVLLDVINTTSNRGKLRMLDHRTAWQELLEIRGGSYNSSGMHWSERQEHEPVYNEEKADRLLLH